MAALGMFVAGCGAPSVASEFAEQLDPATHLEVPPGMPDLYWSVVFSVGFDAGIYDSYRTCVERAPDITLADFDENPVLVNESFDTGYRAGVVAFEIVCAPAAIERSELADDRRERHVFRFTRFRYNTADSHPDLSRGRAAAARVVELAGCDTTVIATRGRPPPSEINGSEFIEGYLIGLDEATTDCAG